MKDTCLKETQGPMETSFPPRIKYGVNSSGNPNVVPAKAGNHKILDSCFCRNDNGLEVFSGETIYKEEGLNR